MKKSLIALAALATVGAAQAQSSVTVYGSMDLGYQALSYDNIGGQTGAGSQDKTAGIAGSALTSNRFGLRGTEDLGGGLRANFNLEYGIANNLVGDTVTTSTQPATGLSSGTNALPNDTPGIASGTGGALQTRTSRVGLESAKLGRVDIGYGLTGLFATITGHSPLPGNNFIGDVAYSSVTSSGRTAAGTHAGTATNRILAGAVRATGVQYTSPTMNGLQAVVDFGRGSVKNGDLGVTDTQVSNAGLTLRYTAGALALAATAHQLNTDYSATSNVVSKTDFQAYSARYNVTSALTVNALYAKNETNELGLVTGKSDVTQIGATYKMGKTSFVGQYGKGQTDVAKLTSGSFTPSNVDRERTGYQIGAIYDLSKRTNVYAIYGSQEAKFQAAESGTATVTAGTKEKVSGYTVGVRHSF